MAAAAGPAHVTAPDVAGRLPRDSLQTRLLDRFLVPETRLVWIHGGPGWGKTSFAAEAYRRHPDAALWLRLDESDADPAALLVHLQEALDIALGRSDARLPMLSREQLGTPWAHLRLSFRALFAALPPHALLVFDEVHRSGSDAALLGWLGVLVEECRAGQRMIGLSRRALPPELARQVLHGAITPWPAETLAFDGAELGLWFKGQRGDPLLPTAVIERCHGWPVAVMLALNAVLDATARVSTGGMAPIQMLPSALAAYVDNEVLGALRPDALAVLRETAWLPVIHEVALAALNAPSESGSLLDRLARDGALVDREAQPGSAARWRVHELLRERLREQALRDEAPSRVAARIACTARWLESDGDDEAALACWLDAAMPPTERWTEADRLLQKLAARWLAQQRQRSLRDAILQIPELQRSAGLWWRLAQAQAPFDPAAARSSAERALAMLAADAKADRLRCLSLIIATYFQAFDSTTPLAHWMEQLEALDLDPDAIEPEQRAMLAVGVWSALFLRDPTHPAQPAWQVRVRAVLLSPVNPDIRVRAAMLLAKHGWYTGRHHDILPLVQQVEGALRDPALTPYSRLVWCLLRQYDAWARADWGAGQAAADEGLEFARTSGIHLLDQYLRLHAACFADLSGDSARASAWLADAAQNANSAKPMEVWHLFSTRAWLMLRAGRDAEAEAASTLAIAAGDAMGPRPRALAMVVRCHALRALGRETEAQRTLLDLEHAAASGNLFASAHAALLRADLALARGDAAAAHSPLAHAFAIVRQQGLHALFGAAPARLARLAAFAFDDGIEAASVTAMVRAQRLVPPPDANARWPWPVRVHTLGRFEIEVDGVTLRYEGKVPKRPLELLQALIAHGGCAPVAWLADALWPEAEGDRANDAFEVALRRLRQLLGHPDALRLSGGELVLEPCCVWVDAIHRRQRAEQGGEAGVPGDEWPDSVFLPDCEAAWVHAARAQLAALRRRAGAAQWPAAEHGDSVSARTP